MAINVRDGDLGFENTPRDDAFTLRGTERISFPESVDCMLACEVVPYAPDAAGQEMRVTHDFHTPQ